MRKSRLYIPAIASLLVAGGCNIGATSVDITEPVLNSVDRRVTLEHHYAVPQSWAEFQERVRLEQQAKRLAQRSTMREAHISGAPGCGDDEMLRSGQAPHSGGGMTIQPSPGAQQLGTIHVYAANPNDPGPSWLLLGAFAVPERALEIPCDWGGSGYGSTGSAYTHFMVDVYGEEEADYPPAEPPPGMSMEDWNALNPAEKLLVLKYLVFLPELILARSQAESWSQQQTNVGAHNGPQDALRHAYWQCRLTKLITVGVAKEWGDAHEKYNIEYSEVRMDLFNNRVGRMAGLQAAACSETILEAWQSNSLALAPMPGPNQHPLGGGYPPPPPQYEQ